ncbi:MAG: nitronate monooxygenase family protein [Candidatus Sericytochromatia bacterium]|nr:nitronate monooxygenase family protein [Candidatus Sericytochromatia bacterium]
MSEFITTVFGIKYPIVQAGMVWCSGNKLAAAASEAGALGLIGGGSMRPDTFRAHIQRMRQRTTRPWGVNIPIFHKYAAEQITIALEENVSIFFTSAGNPRIYTPMLKSAGAKVVHVVATPAQAAKAAQAGCDAVVAEGFEAGGHNGPDELTTLVLVRLLAQTVDIPIIAAGGIADGYAMCAAISAGAHGVQVGSRFAVTQESSAHPGYKQAVIKAQACATVLALKKIGPARFLKNAFAERILAAESLGGNDEELRTLLGSGRARKGIFEGDIEEGELEVGQVAGLINDEPAAQEVVIRLMDEYRAARGRLPSF